MESHRNTSAQRIAALIHFSAFTQVFFPLGNFIIPLLLWLFKRDHTFVDKHGKEALNFQISFYLYLILLGFISVAAFIFLVPGNMQISFFQEGVFDGERLPPAGIVAGMLAFGSLLLGLTVLYFYTVISATIAAAEGRLYSYPLAIQFIRQQQPDQKNDPSTTQKMTYED